MLKTIGIIGVLAVGFLGLTGPTERMMVYPFDRAQISPANAGVPKMREVLFESGGETLVLWVAKPNAGKPTILYFHGNAGNLANRAPRFATFMGHGFGVVAMAYRGSSGSTGTPSQQDIIKDAVNVYMSMPKLAGDSTVIFYGESLGTGVAILTASTKTVSEMPPAAMVLEAPYTSIPDVARHAYPQLGSAVGVLKNIWPTKDWIGQLNIPLLVLHGAEDPLIPIGMGREVFDLSPATDKAFFAVKGAGHNNVWQPEALEVLFRFLSRF